MGTDAVGGTELAGATGAPQTRSEVLRRAARAFPVFGALFLILAIFVAEDLAADAAAGIGALHMAIEAVSLGVALVGVGIAARQYYCALRRADALQDDLQRTRADVERWRAEAETLLTRFRTALDHEFEAWGLTDAEREIAVLILKGLSYKEIANERGTTERTVRHQALAIYRKAGLAGRAEMAAHFLEAFLLPVRRAADAEAERSEGATPIPAGSARI